MKIMTKSIVERIEVLHNSREEMRENVKELKEQGWSPNTRSSVVGLGLDNFELFSEADVAEFKKEHPEIVVHPAEEKSFFKRNPYVYYTIHEKITSTERNVPVEKL